MRYYLLEESVDAREIGDFPQVQGWLPPHNPWGEGGIYRVPSVENHADFDLELPVFVLAPRARVTDLLSTILHSRFMVLSDRLFDLIQQFNLDEHRTFKGKVQMHDRQSDYNFIYWQRFQDADYVNWGDTRFQHKNKAGQKFEIQFDNLQNLREKSKRVFLDSDGEIEASSLRLNHSAIKYDLFFLLWVSRGCFVSERVKQAIEDNGITGVRFIDAEGS